MYVPTNKNIAAETVSYIISALRDPHLGNIFVVVFIGSHLKMYYIELTSLLLYILE